MPFKVSTTSLSDVLVIEPKSFEDHRGFFLESYNERDFVAATGLNVRFVQDNHSQSSCGVLRGLHYQIEQPQGKLIRVVTGEVFDVCVNMQRNHPQFGQWTGVYLNAKDKKMLWIPPGFAHGFLVLSESSDVLYKTTDYYSPDSERCLVWDDPQVCINWPLNQIPNSIPILTAKDLAGRSLSDADLFN